VIILLKRLLSLFLCAVLLLPITVYGEDINISAYSAIVMDSATKFVFYEHNAYDELAMASTTKIMTCLIACESKKLNKTVTITQDMLDGIEGTMIYVSVGDKITLLDLIKGAMLASGNDAANAIAVFVGGSKQNFVKLMNKKAKNLVWLTLIL
jgi:D-alanyl-D-alanine carboxypeptidase